MIKTGDIIGQLYNSPDPLCLQAAALLSELQKQTIEKDRDAVRLLKATTVLLLAMDEIVRLSVERDNPKKKLTEAEFKKRFSEIIHICSDAYFSYQRVIDADDETLC